MRALYELGLQVEVWLDSSPSTSIPTTLVLPSGYT